MTAVPCLLGVLLASAALAQPPADRPKLAYLVILSRHGVRSPTGTNESLRQYAAAPWPEWGVAPGELTERGGKLMEILGAWYRGWLARDGLVPLSGCEGASRIYVRADSGQRTRESGRRFVAGMFAGCGIAVHTAETDADPLFHSVAAGIAHGDAKLSSAAVSGRIGGHPDALAATLQPAFRTLRQVLFGCPIDAPCPGEKQPGKQALLDLPASIAGTEDGLADIRGPIRTGSTLAENLLLEYANGMSGQDLGWAGSTRISCGTFWRSIPLMPTLEGARSISPAYKVRICCAT